MSEENELHRGGSFRRLKFTIATIDAVLGRGLHDEAGRPVHGPESIETELEQHDWCF